MVCTKVKIIQACSSIKNATVACTVDQKNTLKAFLGNQALKCVNKHVILRKDLVRYCLYNFSNQTFLGIPTLYHWWLVLVTNFGKI